MTSKRRHNVIGGIIILTLGLLGHLVYGAIRVYSDSAFCPVPEWSVMQFAVFAGKLAGRLLGLYLIPVSLIVPVAVLRRLVFNRSTRFATVSLLVTALSLLSLFCLETETRDRKCNIVETVEKRDNTNVKPFDTDGLDLAKTAVTVRHYRKKPYLTTARFHEGIPITVSVRKYKGEFSPGRNADLDFLSAAEIADFLAATAPIAEWEEYAENRAYANRYLKWKTKDESFYAVYDKFDRILTASSKVGIELATQEADPQ